MRVIGVPDPGYPGEAGEPWAGESNAFGVEQDLFASGAREIGAGAVHLEVEKAKTLEATHGIVREHCR